MHNIFGTHDPAVCCFKQNHIYMIFNGKNVCIDENDTNEYVLGVDVSYSM